VICLVKKAMIEYVKRDKNDDYYTPKYAVKPLMKFIPKNYVIWECTDDCESNITKLFRERGHKVISTSVKRNFDFLTDIPDFDFDVIITNPPYSLKTEFLKKCYELGKPFALLLPITTLEGVERGKLFRKYGIEVLVFDRRINYDDGRVWFNSSWFCWKLLPERLMFVELKCDGDVNGE